MAGVNKADHHLGTLLETDEDEYLDLLDNHALDDDEDDEGFSLTTPGEFCGGACRRSSAASFGASDISLEASKALDATEDWEGWEDEEEREEEEAGESGQHGPRVAPEEVRQLLAQLPMGLRSRYRERISSEALRRRAAADR
ncbi:unnamed protein product, partial [Polarella glacialis]